MQSCVNQNVQSSIWHCMLQIVQDDEEPDYRPVCSSEELRPTESCFLRPPDGSSAPGGTINRISSGAREIARPAEGAFWKLGSIQGWEVYGRNNQIFIIKLGKSTR